MYKPAPHVSLIEKQSIKMLPDVLLPGNTLSQEFRHRHAAVNYYAELPECRLPVQAGDAFPHSGDTGAAIIITNSTLMLAYKVEK